jgi:hypothetical protein
MNIPLTPSLKAEIERLAQAEALKPRTTARRLILAGLAAQQQQTTQTEVRYG